MQFELTVSVYDLRVLLLGQVDSGASLAVKLDDGAMLENCKVLGYDYDSDVVSLTRMNNDAAELDISLYKVEAIEFESFHSYRGNCAKVFTLN